MILRKLALFFVFLPVPYFSGKTIVLLQVSFNKNACIKVGRHLCRMKSISPVDAGARNAPHLFYSSSRPLSADLLFTYVLPIGFFFQFFTGGSSNISECFK